MGYGETAVIREGDVQLNTFEPRWEKKNLKNKIFFAQNIKKKGYPNFMMKEIYEQPQSVSYALEDRLLFNEGDVLFEEINLSDREFKLFERICLVACDKSWHAALAGKYLLEEHCNLSVVVDLVSKSSCLNSLILEKTLVIVLSSPGETDNTQIALREARMKGTHIVSICNLSDTLADCKKVGVINTYAGHENGVASTKAFTSQLVVLYLLAIRLGRANGSINLQKGRNMVTAVSNLPSLIERTLLLDPQLEEVACEYLTSPYAICLGGGSNYSIALEGALKLKELSHIQAEGFPVGELKRRVNPLIAKDMPVFALAPYDRHIVKVRSCIEGLISYGCNVIAFCTEGDQDSRKKATFTLQLPRTGAYLSSVLSAVTLQLMAYKFAILKGKNVDKSANNTFSASVDINPSDMEWRQSCMIFQRI